MSDENVGGLVELLPCPFCGSQPKLETHRKYHSYSARDSQRDGMGVSAGGFSTTSWSVDCACGISVTGNNDAFLVQRWNTRVSAHGRPVVDDGMVERFCEAFFSPQWSVVRNHHNNNLLRDMVSKALIAALTGATP